MAPSSHNSQPWKFTVEGNQVKFYADETRWLKIADPNKRELHISVGCALENFLIAAEHFGFNHQVSYFPKKQEPALVAKVDLEEDGRRSSFRDPELLEAIPLRHTNRKVYEDRPISQDDLNQLQDCAVEHGVWLHLASQDEIKHKVDQLVARANAVQFADPDYREELAFWIGQGAFSTSRLVSKLGQLAVAYLNVSKTQIKKDSEVLMSAPVLAVLATERDELDLRVKVGQVFERVSLTVTMLGIKVHPMSQILEVPETRAEIAELIPVSSLIPQHTFRMGYAEEEIEHTPRRPVEEVLV